MTCEGMLGTADFEQIQVLRDPASGARAILALHDTRLGPAFGGIRRRGYADFGSGLADALALARAMTWKCALAGLPAGGGKAVLFDDGGDRAAGYVLVGRFVEQMGGRFFTGPDAGTGDDDLRLVCAHTRFCASPDADGPGDLAGSTARGVAAAIAATARHLGAPIRGLHVLVQGFGAVGSRLCGLLAEAGARLSVAEPAADLAERAQRELGAGIVPPGAALSVPCDLFAPCAFGGVLDAAAAAALPARAVCGAANNVLAEPAAGLVLHRRGIPVAPDFVANAGALIHGVLWHLTGVAPEPRRIERIGDTVSELLRQARNADRPPGELALDEARRRVAAAAPGPYLPPRRAL